MPLWVTPRRLPFSSMQRSLSSFRQIVNPNAALLSNYEVLQLLKELEADHIARTRTAQRLKKEEDDAAAATGHPPLHSPDPPLSVSENLRTIEVEVSSATRHFAQTFLSIHLRPSSTSPQTISPPVCRPQRASSASRRTSPLSVSPKPKSSRSLTSPPSSPSNSTSCVLLLLV